jgi:DNA invertase Pin-like site-specific DNA recombinase
MGLVWRAAHSGRTVYRSSEMAAMLAAARAGAFDVLLVGYVSRWQRNLRRTLELLEDVLHPAGVAVYFCDEEILSSSERHWDQLVDEAKDAERYSRRLSRRIREGYASKGTKQADPGGHAPFGFRRNEAKLIEPDPDQIEIVRRCSSWRRQVQGTEMITAMAVRLAELDGAAAVENSWLIWWSRPKPTHLRRPERAVRRLASRPAGSGRD